MEKSINGTKDFLWLTKTEVFPEFQKLTLIVEFLLIQISHPLQGKACNMASTRKDEKLINDLKDVDIDIRTVC